MSEQKKEFKVGDEVWFTNIYGVTRTNIKETTWSAMSGKDEVCILESGHTLLVEHLFHTPQKLLENIKQQIDGMDKN